MYYFSTLFDKNYFSRGLALYFSLVKHCETDFRLWVLCLDDVVFDLLTTMGLPHVELIRLQDFEDDDLRQAKNNRSLVEYYWTMTPSLPRFILRKYPDVPHVAYLDADIFFFDSPRVLYDEFVDHSILIVKHNYSPKFVHKEKTAGVFNVEFLLFRQNDEARACLEEWREQCNEWCYLQPQEGKMGDQMYLNAWPETYAGLRVLQHHGGGVAPWNVNQYSIQARDGKIFVGSVPLVFYHFHAFRWFENGRYNPAEGYWLHPQALRLIYPLYQAAQEQALAKIRAVDPAFAFGFAKPNVLSLAWRKAAFAVFGDRLL